MKKKVDFCHSPGKKESQSYVGGKKKKIFLLVWGKGDESSEGNRFETQRKSDRGVTKGRNLTVKPMFRGNSFADPPPSEKGGKRKPYRGRGDLERKKTHTIFSRATTCMKIFGTKKSPREVA